MIPAIEDTIVAQASVPGSAARAIVRLGGPAAKAILERFFTSNDPSIHFQAGSLRVSFLHSPLPVYVLWQPGPHTYTGQDLAEIHLIGCQSLVEALIAEFLNAGARSAEPGEFTLRGFLAGKRDLTQSEAVLAVIEARDKTELKLALNHLAGGVNLPLASLRDDLLNLLADVEAGLDFADEDIDFIDRRDLLLRIGKGLAQLINLRRQLADRAVESQVFRVALVGEPNAGKSSLFNCLVGDSAAIVSPVAGTTRDYLSRTVRMGHQPIELIDTAGWQESTDIIEEQAQELGRDWLRRAELVLECIEASSPFVSPMPATEPNLKILTKCDLHSGPEGMVRTSSRTGLGIQEVRRLIEQKATAFFHPGMAPSLSRCRHHVESCISHLRNAHTCVLNEEGAEILAAEVRLALEELGALTGAVHTEELLGRIFGRFCVGK